jgi:hypothetical protein
MRKVVRSLLVVITTIALSCNSADNKVPQIASDFCNCFASIEKKLSAPTIDVLTKASNAGDPETALQDEIKKLDEEEQMKIGAEMMSLGEVEDPNSELGRCIKDVEKKYGKAYTLNQKKFGEKIIKELESKGGCTLTAAIMKLGLKIEGKK